MRFICPDTTSPFDSGGINAYSYCGGDPINNIDPSGHNKFLKGIRNIFGRKESLEKKIRIHIIQRTNEINALREYRAPYGPSTLAESKKTSAKMSNDRSNFPNVEPLSKEAIKYREKHYGAPSETYRATNKKIEEFYEVFDRIRRSSDRRAISLENNNSYRAYNLEDFWGHTEYGLSNPILKALITRAPDQGYNLWEELERMRTAGHPAWYFAGIRK